MASAGRSRGRASRGDPSDPAWVSWSDEQILDLRLCDLGIRLRGSWIEARLARLHAEIEGRGIRFKPHAWLGNEWFSPDGIPGIAAPFYLAHPRLMHLERRQMLQVEGGTHASCMRILRHEAGHAFDTAYRLRRTRRWQQAFGRASLAYPQAYRPRAGSRDFVLHLGGWYAQSHPCEDFAETFAVWLTPRSRWRLHYAGWPALRKLEYVESIVEELGRRPAVVRSRAHADSLPALKMTLRQHYAGRRERYGVDRPDNFDRPLERIFFPGRSTTREPAGAFLRRVGPSLGRRVVRITGAHPYTVAQLLDRMVTRARGLGLRRSRGERRVKREAAALLQAQVLDYVRGGGRPLPL